MIKYLILTAIVICTIFSCKEKSALDAIHPIAAVYQETKKIKLNQDDLKNWHLKDIIFDTIPGLSMSRINKTVIEELFTNKSEVIVAVLDSDIDINHEYLKDFIWINESEIPNNGVDDDKNGFVDDRNGWNFICSQDGENSIHFSYEYTRILKKHALLEANLSSIQLDSLSKDANYTQTYLRAKKTYETHLKDAIDEKSNSISMDKNNKEAKDWLNTIFNGNAYTAKDLDSLKPIYAYNEKYTFLLTVKSNFLTYNYTDKVIAENLKSSIKRVDKLLNLQYNDRLHIKDDETNILNTDYGCGDVISNASLLNHGTTVAGAIVSVLNPIVKQANGKASFKIMPLSISAVGDENDKDIALAIRYAVDNGADIINMSSSKSFSMHQDWVQDAMTYANQQNVLIVTSAGNEREDLDKAGIYNYPNDLDLNNKEKVSNFIKVGASGYELNSSLKRKSSNYGKRDVDFFAPGTYIYTSSTSEEKFQFSNGTSLSAPLTSGVAALIKLAHPNYSPSKIKEILINSGVSYEVPIILRKGKTDTLSKPFNELSKSGKILNAYNALILAKKG